MIRESLKNDLDANRTEKLGLWVGYFLMDSSVTGINAGLRKRSSGEIADSSGS
jgi:hypothetical protein